MADLSTFSRALDDSKERAVRGLVEAQKAIATKAYSMIAADSRSVSLKYGSPVWSGRYRASHTIAIGTPDTSVKEAPQVDVRWPDEPSTVLNAPPVSRAAQVLSGLKPFSVVFIANALPYARRIENGYSKLKAPAGVYEATAQAVRSLYGRLRLKDFIR